MQSRKSNNPDDPSDVEENQPTAAKHKKPYETPAFRYEKVFVTTALSCRKVSPVACSGATKSSWRCAKKQPRLLLRDLHAQNIPHHRSRHTVHPRPPYNSRVARAVSGPI
jgi:hypothetical protein